MQPSSMEPAVDQFLTCKFKLHRPQINLPGRDQRDGSIDPDVTG